MFYKLHFICFPFPQPSYILFHLNAANQSHRDRSDTKDTNLGIIFPQVTQINIHSFTKQLKSY